jgi:DNA polymerase III epsilon subunit-like protein
MKVLIFDTETTGLPESNSTSILETDKWPYIVQISWILYDTNLREPIEINDDIINCEIDIPEISSNIHGITNAISKEKGICIKYAMDKFDKVLIDCDRDYWLTSTEAKNYGAIDIII